MAFINPQNSISLESGIYLQSQINNINIWSGSSTGIFYPLTGNPSGFIRSSETGLLTGQFYPLNSNPANYLTSSSAIVNTIIATGTINSGSLTGIVKISGAGDVSVFTGISGSIIVSGDTGAYTNFALNSQTGQFITTAQTGLFSSTQVTGSPALAVINLTGAGNVSVTTGGGTLVIFSGNTGAYANFTTPFQTGLLTGQFYPLSSNPAGYLTSSSAGVTSIAVTGFINTGNITGIAKISGAGDITTFTGISGLIIISGDTGAYTNFITPSQTGLLTGQFYPLSSNPAGYLTSSSAGVSSIVATGITNSGVLTGVVKISGGGNISVFTGISGSVIISGNTGSLTGTFYPLYSNPSGYVVGTTGTGILNGQLLIGASGINGFQQSDLYATTGLIILSGSGSLGVGIDVTKVVTGLVAGSNITVSNNGTGLWTINSVGGGGSSGISSITTTGAFPSGIRSGSVFISGAGNVSVITGSNNSIIVSGAGSIASNVVTAINTFTGNTNLTGQGTIVISTGSYGTINISGGSNTIEYLYTIANFSGLHKVWIPAYTMTPSQITGATTGTIFTLSSGHTIDVLEFSSGSGQSAYFNFSFPKVWDKTNITPIFYWTTTGNVGTINWGIAAADIKDGNSLDIQYNEGYTISDSTISGNYIHQTTGVPLTISGSLADDDQCYFKVYRSAGGSLGSNGKLIGVGIGYYETGLNATSITGVSSLNQLTGILNLTGAGIISITTGISGTITISGSSASSNVGVNSIAATGIINTGYFTGSVILSGAGNITTFTGDNTNKLIVISGNTGAYTNFITPSQTGLLTGQFYPLNSNPSEYLTNVSVGGVRTIITTGQFPSGTISGNVVLSGAGNVNVFTGINSSIIISGNTGAYSNFLTSSSITGTNEIWIDSAAMLPVTAVTGTITTGDLVYDVLDFSQTASLPSAQFKLSFPLKWNNSVVKGQFYWTVTGGTGVTGSVIWGLASMARKHNDPFANLTFGTGELVTGITTTGERLHMASTPFMTISGSPSNSNLCMFKVYRNSGSLTGNARLLGLSLQYYDTGVNTITY